MLTFPSIPSLSFDVSAVHLDRLLPGCGKSSYPPSLLHRVIGGSEATKGAYPWQVSLLLAGNHGCGGTLVNSRWIVSAAHCFLQSTNPASYRVRTGEYDQRYSEGTETDYSVERIIVHQSYNGQAQDNDIAVMKLSRDVDTSSAYVQPACLPTYGDNFEGSSDCWMSGWGATGGATVTQDHQDKVLRHVGGSALTFSSCANYYGSELHQGMICFGTQTTGGCFGDSGGPMVCRRNGVFTLAGATSWGTPNCNGKPTIFADVVFYLNWINEQMSKY
ncbi:chymotrypsinogen A-like [Lineus longissimus]|uniref:chymotrypsinogen A-like n=1 Tax=Lineus longissimus TaxID=88925 RepID=UPI00315D1852